MTKVWVSYIHFLSKIFFYDKMDLRHFYFHVTIWFKTNTNPANFIKKKVFE